MASASPSPAVSRPRRRGLSKSACIGLGLLFTLIGLFLLSALLPTHPNQFLRLLPVAAAGLAVLWVGGILMGIGSRS